MATEPTNPSLSFIWEVIAPFRKRAFFVLAIMLADTALTSTGIGMILPLFQTMLSPEGQSGWLIQFIPGVASLTPEKRTLAVAVITVAVFTAKFIMGLCHAGFSRDFAERMRTYWSTRIGWHNLYGPYSDIVRQKQGILLNNWLNEPTYASKFLLTYMQYLSSLVLTFALIILGLTIHWKIMTGFTILATLILLAVRRRALKLAVNHSRSKLKLNQRLSASLSESLSLLKDIKILRAESNRLEKMVELLHQLRLLFVKMTLIGELPRLLGEFMAVFALVAVLAATTFIEGFTVAKVLPMLAFFFVASYRIITAGTLAMTAQVKSGQEVYSVQLVHAISQQVGEESRGGVPITELNTPIRFEQVTFSHEPNRPLFTNLNLVLLKGQLIFLTGKSGSGKTTMLDLLLRLHHPQTGSITANHRNISEFNLIDWRRLFGYVSQEAALFHGSIRMNIQLGCPQVADGKIEEACHLAGCYDFIAGLPKGYETLVGERGLALSGGQRKRIAIARALVGNPQILILDEATTSFEMEIEQNIIQVLRQKKPGLTILQITHRLPAFAEADLILCLENVAVSENINFLEDLPQKVLSNAI